MPLVLGVGACRMCRGARLRVAWRTRTCAGCRRWRAHGVAADDPSLGVRPSQRGWRSSALRRLGTARRAGDDLLAHGDGEWMRPALEPLAMAACRDRPVHRWRRCSRPKGVRDFIARLFGMTPGSPGPLLVVMAYHMRCGSWSSRLALFCSGVEDQQRTSASFRCRRKRRSRESASRYESRAISARGRGVHTRSSSFRARASLTRTSVGRARSVAQRVWREPSASPLSVSSGASHTGTCCAAYRSTVGGYSSSASRSFHRACTYRCSFVRDALALHASA